MGSVSVGNNQLLLGLWSLAKSRCTLAATLLATNPLAVVCPREILARVPGKSVQILFPPRCRACISSRHYIRGCDPQQRTISFQPPRARA